MDDEERDQFHSFDSNDKAVIAAQFHRFEGDEDGGVEVENIEGEWINVFENESKQVLLNDVTFETLENQMLAVDHIIICGMVENIRHFVMPLRSENCEDPSPIVILHDELPTPK